MNDIKLPKEVEERFDKKVNRGWFQGKDAEGYLDIIEYVADDLPKIKQFLAQELQSQLHQVEEMIEGMKKSVLDLYADADISSGTQGLARQVEGKDKYNQALEDLKSKLKSLREEV